MFAGPVPISAMPTLLSCPYVVAASIRDIGWLISGVAFGIRMEGAGRGFEGKCSPLRIRDFKPRRQASLLGTGK
jgi:hypothetical protein